VRAQAKRGRYFPLAVGRVAKLVGDWHLGDWPARRPLHFENPDASFHQRLPLVRLRPCQSLTIFSLPEGHDEALGANATLKAIAACRRFNRPDSKGLGHKHRSFVVYLEALATLRVAERVVYYRPRKYRGADKFSTAGKPQILRIEERDIELVPLA
jgi:hypothetical protein